MILGAEGPRWRGRAKLSNGIVPDYEASAIGRAAIRAKPREDTMVEKVITPPANVVDLTRYLPRCSSVRAASFRRICCHCGAALMEGEREDECSAISNLDVAGLRLRWQAAQILRGLS
jgi:hypothetical protein